MTYKQLKCLLTERNSYMFNFPGLDTCSKHTIAWLYIEMFGVVFSSRSNSFLQLTCRSYQRTYQV